MNIRECTESDYVALHNINTTAFGYEYPLIKTKERLSLILKSPGNKIYVACENNTVIGYIHVSDYECTYFDSLKNIMAIAVLEKYRGIGAGKALLHAAESWAKACGCCGVRLVSGFNREKAHGFYEHCGYAHRKDQKNFIKYF